MVTVRARNLRWAAVAVILAAVALVPLIVLRDTGDGTGGPAAVSTDDGPAAARVGTGASGSSVPPSTEATPGWPAADRRGNGQTVTLAFGGDVHFEGALGSRLRADPSRP